jgi:hypothetical protein
MGWSRQQSLRVSRGMNGRLTLNKVGRLQMLLTPFSRWPVEHNGHRQAVDALDAGIH